MTTSAILARDLAVGDFVDQLDRYRVGSAVRAVKVGSRWTEVDFATRQGLRVLSTAKAIVR